MKVFLITSGTYEDYSIACICSTPEKAAEAVKLFEESKIEEYEMDAIPEHPQGLFPYHVVMATNGEFMVEVANASMVKSMEVIKIPQRLSTSEVLNRMPEYCQAHGTFYLWAKHEQDAVRIANEIRLQLIVENKWMRD